jgi:cytochrome c oxidase subunit 4
MADSHAPHTPAPADPHAPAAAHGHGHGHDDAAHVAKHVKGYLMVGTGLLVLTGVTVWLSYVDFGSQNWNIIVAMIVATFKAGMVAAIFMHLKGERVTIWRFLYFTAFFVFGLFMLTLFHYVDPITGTSHTHH